MDACCRPGMEDNRKKDFTDKTFLFIRQKTTAKKKSTYLFFAEGNKRTFKIPSFNWFDLDII